MKQIGDAGKNVPTAKKGLSMLHKLCHRVFSISDTFLKLGRNQGNCFSLVQLQAACQAFLGQETCLGWF
jgi:hypothetical protein